MKMRASIMVSILLISQVTFAQSFEDFLKTCMYGTLVGATVGLATVAFSDNPGGRINNVARGASLGLYAGIGIGLYADAQSRKSQEFGMMPLFDEKNSVDGVFAHAILFDF